MATARADKVVTVRIDLTTVAIRGGIGRYVKEMLLPLIAERPDWNWGGYTHLPKSLFSAFGLRGCDLFSSSWPGDAGRLATQLFRLPRWSRIDSPRIFWGPGSRLPNALPASTAVILTVHDMLWLMEPQTMRPVTRWLDARLMPNSLRRADRIIAVSHSTANDIQRFFPGVASKIRVIHEGVADLPPPLSRDSLRSLGIHGYYVLFVGTMEPRKNLRRLIEAFNSLSDAERQSIKLVIVGGAGWGKDDYIEKSVGGGIDGAIRVLGCVSDELLSTLYKHALFLVMPSLYEGFCLPVVEAMSTGTPVLASNRSALPEVVGEGGITFDPLDVRAIARAMAHLMSDESMRSALSVSAIRQAGRFSWIYSAKETIRLMQEILDEKVYRCQSP